MGSRLSADLSSARVLTLIFIMSTIERRRAVVCAFVVSHSSTSSIVGILGVLGVEGDNPGDEASDPVEDAISVGDDRTMAASFLL